MREFDSNTAGHFATATGIMSHTLFWMVARNRTTGAAEPVGFWTGDDHQTFTVGGVNRTYLGAGGLLGLPALMFEAGLSVRNYTFSMASLAPEVAEALRYYEPRLAPVEVHRALFDAQTGALVSAPYRLLSGIVDDVQIVTPATGGQGSASVSVASSARALTRALPIFKSDEQQKLRGGDRFRRWVDVSGSVDVYWGSKRATIAPPAGPKPAPVNGKPDGYGGR